MRTTEDEPLHSTGAGFFCIAKKMAARFLFWPLHAPCRFWNECSAVGDPCVEACNVLCGHFNVLNNPARKNDFDLPLAWRGVVVENQCHVQDFSHIVFRSIQGDRFHLRHSVLKVNPQQRRCGAYCSTLRSGNRIFLSCLMGGWGPWPPCSEARRLSSLKDRIFLYTKPLSGPVLPNDGSQRLLDFFTAAA